MLASEDREKILGGARGGVLGGARGTRADDSSKSRLVCWGGGRQGGRLGVGVGGAEPAVDMQEV